MSRVHHSLYFTRNSVGEKTEAEPKFGHDLRIGQQQLISAVR